MHELMGFKIEYAEGENPLAILVGVLLLILEERADVLLRGFLEQLLVYAHHGDITHTRETIHQPYAIVKTMF